MEFFRSKDEDNLATMKMKATLLLCAAISTIFISLSAEEPISDVPIVTPLFQAYPCGDLNRDIVIWFESGASFKNQNRYYVFVKRAIPKDSKVYVRFDSPVKMTFIVKQDTSSYARLSMKRGRTFRLHFFAQLAGLSFIVKGTQPGVIPYLQGFSVNGEEFCEEPKVGFLEQFTAQNVVQPKTSCGRRRVEHSELIVSGAPTKPGDWPWHAAVYQLHGVNKEYSCGGTLVSKLFVLTAAHCVTYRGSKYSTDHVNVVLGKYTLFGDDEESVEKDVSRIIIHERFDFRRLHNDIALLKLSTEAQFNDFIQPACLLRPDDRSKLSTDQMLGTIVGWGFDSNDSLSRTLRQASMPIVSEATCLRSSPGYYVEVLHDNTFCAGYHNGTSACNGDSGSAFQVYIPDGDVPTEGGSWHVKGIVSNTLSRHHEGICDPEQYVVFTDVETFVDWIDKYID